MHELPADYVRSGRASLVVYAITVLGISTVNYYQANDCVFDLPSGPYMSCTGSASFEAVRGELDLGFSTFVRLVPACIQV